MASTYSDLKFELIGTGEQSGTWGTTTNDNIGTAIEQAITGFGNPIFTTDANLTITLTDTVALQTARALVLNATSSGSLTATRELVVPTIEKQYIVQNNTTGGQSITVKTSAGTGITVPNGRKAHLYVNGTDVIQMFDFVDINGGTIDGTPVGSASASTGAFTSLNASGATTLDGTVALGNAAGDLITVPGTVNSNLVFTDNSFDIGAAGVTRPRNLFLAGAATVAGNLSVGGTLTLTGGVNLNGNVTVGDSSADTLTINSTVTSNLIFTDNTYDIGASGATRPRNLFVAGNATIGGAQTLTGALTVDSTTDSTSTTTGSIQTDGGVGIAKALVVGTNLTFTGTGNRITGDMSNATLANRVAFQTSTVDGSTAVGAIPNGTGTNALFLSYGSSDTANASRSFFGTVSGETTVRSDLVGTGTYLPMTFYTGGSERMRVDTSGNLGIGTAAPGTKLQIVAAGSTDVRSSVGNANAGFQMGVEATGPCLLANFVAQPIYIATNGTERMRVDSVGNVGIGTASPTNALQLVGTAKASSQLYVGSNSDDNYSGGVQNLSNSSRSISIQADPTNAGASTILTFGVDGTERMRIDSSGNVGIGTSSPAGRLHARFDAGVGDGYTGKFIFQTTDQRLTLGTYWESGVGQYARIQSSTDAGTAQTLLLNPDGGNVGIGTASPGEKLDVNGNSRAGIATSSDVYFKAQNSAGSLFLLQKSASAAIYTPTSQPLIFDIAGERMRIDSSGNLLVGTTSAVGKLTVSDANDRTEATSQFSITGAGYTGYHFLNGTAYHIGQNSNSRDVNIYSGSNTAVGVRLVPGGVAWIAYSDERMKDIIEPIENAAQKVSTLRTVIGKYKTDEADKRRVFMIAQDVQAVLPEAVVEDSKGMLGMAYDNIVPLLTAAIKEQQALITSLTARITALEST